MKADITKKENLKQIENYARSIKNRTNEIQLTPANEPVDILKLQSIFEFAEQIEEIAKALN